MTQSFSEPLSGLSAIVEAYDVILCDIWGVVHNGASGWDAAINALQKARDHGVSVIMLSNSPRPSAAIPTQFRSLGIEAVFWDGVVTSGDVTAVRMNDAYRHARTFHLGPPRDAVLLDVITTQWVDSADQADVVLCSGLRDDQTETEEDYREELQSWHDQGLTLVCANPDRIVEHGHKIIRCAGALAAAYAELGGNVELFGKPHAPIYQTAMRKVAELRGNDVPMTRVLAIGDSVMTDLQGAASQGAHGLFITGGIHAADFGPDQEAPDPSAVADFLQDKADMLPDGAMRGWQARLSW